MSKETGAYAQPCVEVPIGIADIDQHPTTLESYATTRIDLIKNAAKYKRDAKLTNQMREAEFSDTEILNQYLLSGSPESYQVGTELRALRMLRRWHRDVPLISSGDKTIAGTSMAMYVAVAGLHQDVDRGMFHHISAFTGSPVDREAFQELPPLDETHVFDLGDAVLERLALGGHTVIYRHHVD